MKKYLPVLSVLFFSFFSLLAFSCSDISTDAYVFEKGESVISGNEVKLYVSSKSALFSNSSSRQIVPAAYNSSDLNFYIGGIVRHTKNQTENVVVQKVPFTASEGSDNAGTVTAKLEALTYELTLLAIPASIDTISLTETTYIYDLIDKAVLFGKATADLKYNDGEQVNFYLSSDSLSGSGEYDLKIYLKDWSSKSLATIDSDTNASVISSVSIGLYKLSSSSSVSGTFVENQDFTNALAESGAVPYINSSVEAGTYDFVITFYYNGKSFVYSDKIIILPYQKTSATLAIPDILQVVPDAPSDFKQGYLLPSSDESDYYRLCFEWEDNSNTETGFEIQLMDVSENQNATASSLNNEDFWNLNSSAENTRSFTNSFDGNSDWFAGSLSRNSTEAIFYMLLGKRYYARIRAINNDSGASEWIYAESDSVSITIPAGGSTAENALLSYAQNFNSTAFNSPIINLFRLKYNLSGGSISPALATVYYFDQIIGGNPIMAADGSSAVSAYNSGNPVTLTKGSLNWANWACNSVDGRAYQNSFVRCASVSDYDASVTYYVPWNQDADVNGSTIIYEVADPQPQGFAENSYANYYVNSGLPANYVGYKNLSLYAVFEEENPESTITDYSIKTNLGFVASADGASLPVSGYSFEISASATSFSLAYNYTTSAFVYDSVSLSISENGGSEIGTYTPVGQTFTIPVSVFAAGSSYMLTIKASKNGGTYTAILLMNTN